MGGTNEKSNGGKTQAIPAGVINFNDPMQCHNVLVHQAQKIAGLLANKKPIGFTVIGESLLMIMGTLAGMARAGAGRNQPRVVGVRGMPGISKKIIEG